MESIINIYKDGIINAAVTLVIFAMCSFLTEEYVYTVNKIIATAIGG